MTSIYLKHIYSMQDKRPAGYVEEVLALGEVRGSVLYVKDIEKLQALRKKYASLEQFQIKKATKAITEATAKELLKGKNLMEIVGPPLWTELHETTFKGELTLRWLKDFTRRIPCGPCRKHWIYLLQEIPPRYDDQYLWSVEIHNKVNEKLGKPIWVPEIK